MLYNRIVCPRSVIHPVLQNSKLETESLSQCKGNVQIKTPHSKSLLSKLFDTYLFKVKFLLKGWVRNLKETSSKNISRPHHFLASAIFNMKTCIKKIETKLNSQKATRKCVPLNK